MSEREEFGPALRRERERRGITLQEIAAQTKIGASLFAGLERNDVSRWPTGIYRRAFLRAYAKVVGLDGERLVEEFRRLFPEDGDEAGRSQARQEAPAPPDRAGAKEAWKPVHDDATSGDLRLHLDAGSRASASRKQQSGPVKAGTPLQFESSPDAADASPGGLRLHLDSTSAPGAASRSTGRWRHGLTKRLAFLAIDLALVAVAGILSLVVFGGPAVWPALAVSSCVVLVAAPVLVRTTPGTWLLGLARRATVQPMASEAARRRPVELRATVRRYRASSGTSNSSDSVQSRYGSVHAVPRGHRRAARRLGK